MKEVSFWRWPRCLVLSDMQELVSLPRQTLHRSKDFFASIAFLWFISFGLPVDTLSQTDEIDKLGAALKHKNEDVRQDAAKQLIRMGVSLRCPTIGH